MLERTAGFEPAPPHRKYGALQSCVRKQHTRHVSRRRARAHPPDGPSFLASFDEPPEEVPPRSAFSEEPPAVAHPASTAQERTMPASENHIAHVQSLLPRTPPYHFLCVSSRYISWM
jgi:hypothetical protein